MLLSVHAICMCSHSTAAYQIDNGIRLNRAKTVHFVTEVTFAKPVTFAIAWSLVRRRVTRCLNGGYIPFAAVVIMVVSFEKYLLIKQSKSELI